jgi:hypothetical protein
VTVREQAEARTFRTLLKWLQDRTDVQNIDLMNLAGFCRNCFSKWLKASFEALHSPTTLEDTQQMVYGMPYADWKKKYQKPATAEQLLKYEKSHGDAHAPAVDKAVAAPAASLSALRASACAGHAATLAGPAPEEAAPKVEDVPDRPAVVAEKLVLKVAVITISDRASRG